MLNFHNKRIIQTLMKHFKRQLGKEKDLINFGILGTKCQKQDFEGTIKYHYEKTSNISVYFYSNRNIVRNYRFAKSVAEVSIS